MSISGNIEKSDKGVAHSKTYACAAIHGVSQNSLRLGTTVKDVFQNSLVRDTHDERKRKVFNGSEDLRNFLDRKREIKAQKIDKQIQNACIENEEDSDILTENEESEIIGLVDKIAEKNETRMSKINAKIMPMQTGTNNLLNSLIKIQKDKIWTRDDHILNFMSCDCIITTSVGRDLIDKGLIKLADLKIENPELGHVICLKNGKYYIFNLFVKEKFDNKIFLKDIEICFNTLKDALEKMKYQTFSMSRDGNGFDKIPWNWIEKVLKDCFGKGSFRITICTGEIIIPLEKDRTEILSENHDSVAGGHLGETKTYERVRENYYWPGMREDIRKYVKTCDSCQKRKLVRVKTRQPMMITDTPSRVFEKIQMDIVGPLPKTDFGNMYILTWQDCLSKYSGAIPLCKIDATTVAIALTEHIICVFGCPESIQTDQGSNFLSEIMKSIAKIFKIRKYKSSAYDPQSLGALERSHHTFIEYLRHYCERTNWDIWLPYAMFSFNTAVHESTGLSPHRVVFGRDARKPSEFAEENVPRTYVQLVNDILQRLIETESMVVARLEAAKRRCKKYYDRKLNERNFEVGQHVYLLVERKNKLDDHYVGPYQINKIFNDLNVELQINLKETKIVHMNRIKHAFLRF